MAIWLEIFVGWGRPLLYTAVTCAAAGVSPASFPRFEFGTAFRSGVLQKKPNKQLVLHVTGTKFVVRKGQLYVMFGLLESTTFTEVSNGPETGLISPRDHPRETLDAVSKLRYEARSTVRKT